MLRCFWRRFCPLPAGNYHLILTNPPIRAGKKVVYPLVEEAYQRLEPGGRLCLVIRTKQGAKSMEKHMASLFGNVATLAKDKGFRILQSVRIPVGGPLGREHLRQGTGG